MTQKILAPLDGSSLAEQALPYAEAFAKNFDAELILMSVLDPPTVETDYVDGSPKATESGERNAEHYLQGLQNRLHAKNIRTRTLTLMSESAADAIVDVACQEEVDLIVKTTHGRSGLSRWIHGSVATKVLQHAPCPIFLVRVKKDD